MPIANCRSKCFQFRHQHKFDVVTPDKWANHCGFCVGRIGIACHPYFNVGKTRYLSRQPTSIPLDI